jgi:hypothetical protein
MESIRNPYASPDAPQKSLTGPQRTPGVVTWYRVYAVFMALMYFVIFLAGIAVLFFGEAMADEETPAEFFLIYGIVFAAMGVPLLIMYVVGVFMPAKRWAWVYGIILIGIGMTSCCFLPICVPILIFWIKPETQAYFGRSERPLPSAT